MTLILDNLPEGYNPDEAAEAVESNGSIENAEEQAETVIPDKGDEPVVEEVQAQQEDEPEEPSDNKTRSKLGREVAALKEANKKLMDSMQELLQGRPKDPADVEEAEYDPDRLLTVRELEQREQKKVNDKRKYDSAYLLEIEKFRDEDGDYYQEIYDEWNKNHNVTFTGFKDPRLDAKTAYLEARSVVLKNKVAAKTTKFNKTVGEAPQRPTTPVTKTVSTKMNIPDLDDESKSLIAHYGWDEDKVRQVLGGQSKVIATGGGKG